MQRWQALGARTVDLDDVLWNIHELVDEALSIHFGENATLVIIPARSNVRITFQSSQITQKT